MIAEVKCGTARMLKDLDFDSVVYGFLFSSQLFPRLSTPTKFSDGRENTWLCEITVFPPDPSKLEVPTTSVPPTPKNTELDHIKISKNLPCTCDFGMKNPQEQHPAGDLDRTPFKISVKFTLWNETANCPVLYRCDQTTGKSIKPDGDTVVGTPDRRSRPSASKAYIDDLLTRSEGSLSECNSERSPHEALKSIEIESCMDLRIARELLQSTRSSRESLRESMAIFNTPCITHHLHNGAATRETCSISCAAFFSELLLALNMMIILTWVDGVSLLPSISTRKDFPIPEHKKRSKGKSTSMGKGTNRDDQLDNAPVLPPIGSFKPAKILCYDSAMAAFLPQLLTAYRITLIPSAFGKLFEVEKEVDGRGGPDAGGKSNTLHTGLDHQMPDFHIQDNGKAPGPVKGRMDPVGDDKQEVKGSTKRNSAVPAEQKRERLGEPRSNNKEMKNEPVIVKKGSDRDISYGTVPFNKKVYQSYTKAAVQAQHLLLCNNCGVCGVDKVGALPWPTLLRCSACKTSW